MAFGSLESRKQLVLLVGSVVAVDAVAMAIFYGFHLANTGEHTRTIFSISWALATLAVVVVPLRRIRALRNAALRR